MMDDGGGGVGHPPGSVMSNTPAIQPTRGIYSTNNIIPMCIKRFLNFNALSSSTPQLFIGLFKQRKKKKFNFKIFVTLSPVPKTKKD